VRTAKTSKAQAARVSERRAFLTLSLAEAALPGAGARELPSAAQVALLREIAAQRAGSLPAGAAPELLVGEACRHHGVCVAVCPTAALRIYSRGGDTGLEFEAAACIGCGICTLVCPEKALALRAAEASGGPNATTQPVSRHASRDCARCDNQFAARGDEELCPACRKDVQLFTTGFSARSDGP
jgi:ferredoxin